MDYNKGEWLISDQKFGGVYDHAFSKIELSFQRAKTVFKEYQTRNYESMCSLRVGGPGWGDDSRFA